MPTPRLRVVNTVLVIAIIGLNMYTILFPLWPMLPFWANNISQTRQKALSRTIHEPLQQTDTAATRLIIPAMQLDATIHEVSSLRTIRNDIWRRPNSSTPDKGGNTVLVGHRFTYSNPTGVLYHLDKLHLTDEIAITWQAKRYVYRVTDIKIVAPSDTTVEAPTVTPQLTLYTCTPLWNPTHRLVVTAKLERTYE